MVKPSRRYYLSCSGCSRFPFAVDRICVYIYCSACSANLDPIDTSFLVSISDLAIKRIGGKKVLAKVA